MHQVSIKFSKDGKGSFAFGNGCKTFGEIKVHLIDRELILLDTIVLSKSNLHFVGKRILISFNSTINYLC